MGSALSPEARGPTEHPLRPCRAGVDEGRKERSRQCDALSSPTGRPALAPETWLRTVRRQVRSPSRRARLLMEQRDDNVWLRWWVGLHRDDAVWAPPGCSQHRARWLAGAGAQARTRAVLSDDHCPVAGPLMAAWAGQPSLTRQAVQAPSPPPDAHPGNPCLTHRPGGPPVQNGPGPRGPGGVSGAGAQGDSAWLGRRSPEDAGAGAGRAGGGPGPGGGEARPAAGHLGRGDKRCPACLGRSAARAAGHAAGGAAYLGSVERQCWAHHPPSGRRGASAATHGCRGKLWVAQTRGAAAEGPAAWGRPGGLAVHVCCHRVQQGADAHAGGSGMSPRAGQGATCARG
jgi:hypothetical protein